MSEIKVGELGILRYAPFCAVTGVLAVVSGTGKIRSFTTNNGEAEVFVYRGGTGCAYFEFEASPDVPRPAKGFEEYYTFFENPADDFCALWEEDTDDGEQLDPERSLPLTIQQGLAHIVPRHQNGVAWRYGSDGTLTFYRELTVDEVKNGIPNLLQRTAEMLIAE